MADYNLEPINPSEKIDHQRLSQLREKASQINPDDYTAGIEAKRAHDAYIWIISKSFWKSSRNS